jgi:hypothetical protein
MDVCESATHTHQTIFIYHISSTKLDRYTNFMVFNVD